MNLFILRARNRFASWLYKKAGALQEWAWDQKRCEDCGRPLFHKACVHFD